MVFVKTIDLAAPTDAYYASATVSPVGAQIIHVSGQPGSTEDGHVPADYESQIHLALLNLRRIVIAAGASVHDIIKLTVLIANYNPLHRKHTRHIQRFLKGHRPAITLIPVSSLANPEWLFEIDAVLACRPIERPLLPATYQEIVDIVIIGAGLAGLTAASTIQEAGLSCVVLEARSRVGGKTLSQPLSGVDSLGAVDLGAAWMNDTTQRRVYALAKRLGAEILEQNTTGKCVLEDKYGQCSTFEYGELPKFDESTAQDVARIRDMVEADCQALGEDETQNSELDALTFDAYLRSRGAGDTAIATATVWTRAMLGQDPNDISALFFLSYCRAGGGLLQMRSDRQGGGQHLRIRQGMQFMANGLANALPQGMVRLSSPVSCVTQKQVDAVDFVDVTANNRTTRARKLITTVPGSTLKSITFLPALPAAKRVLAESSVYGYYAKAMMFFRTPFWIDKGYCGLIQSFRGPAAVIRDTCSLPDKSYVLTCFMSSDPGRAWSALPTPERETALIQQIGRLFDSPIEASRGFVKMVTYEWAKDEHSGWGCPCAALTPGVLGIAGSSALREPYGNLHFAGTETAKKWKGYMDGAIESGERAADEVIRSLRKERAGRL